MRRTALKYHFVSLRLLSVLLFGIIATSHLLLLPLTALDAQESPLKAGPTRGDLKKGCASRGTCGGSHGRSIIILKDPSVAEVMTSQRESSFTPQTGAWSSKALRTGMTHGATLRRAHTSARQRLTQHRVRVTRSFSLTLNALVVDAPLSLAEAERILPGEVLSIVQDKEVEAFLNQSVPLTKASDLWQLVSGNGLAITGHGIKIGIIDTGIDYTHPDLGGCSRTSDINTSGCAKVVGGYDFVNQDSDPFDDNGHGTHCAATAAGKGALMGVAPDALLYSYKVLSEYGYGFDSDIIAAIERSVDPNGDGDFSDHLDVVSLSLGSSYGDPNDPSSLALDRAASLGVTAVVAAGNSGSSPETIGSPGTSRRAITVGAFSISKELASFSSRGMVSFKDGEKKYMLSKPDVIAPGVEICAALSSQSTIPSASRLCLDTTHFRLSGTSMATPHVAGLAALLKQAHPTWSPDDIKTALKSSASRTLVTSPGTVADHGSGAVDAVAALNSPQGGVAIEEMQLDTISPDAFLRVPIGWSYTLSLSTEAEVSRLDSATWTPLTAGTSSSTQFVTSLNTSSQPQGDYTVRLRAISPAGAVLTDYGRVTVNRYAIAAPAEADVVNMSDPLAVRITKYVDAPVSSFIIEYSVNGGSWRSDGVTAIASSLSGTIQLPTSQSTYNLQVRARILRGSLEDTLVVAGIRVDPTLKRGFPIRVDAECLVLNTGKKLCQSNWVAHPIVADLDGDGRNEIVVWRNTIAPNPNELEIFSHEGKSLRTIKLLAHPLQSYLSFFQYAPWPPLVSDLGGDGKPEIVIVETFFDFAGATAFRTGGVQVLSVYSPQGDLAPGFPVILEGVNRNVLASDLNHDGRKEIILQSTKDWRVTEDLLHIVSDDGTITGTISTPTRADWFREGLEQEGENPVVGNFDLDPDLEVAFFQNSLRWANENSSIEYSSGIFLANWNQFGVAATTIPPSSGSLLGSATPLDENGDGIHELSVPLYPGDDDITRVRHIRFTGGAPILKEFTFPLRTTTCAPSVGASCGGYENGFTVGRLKGLTRPSAIGISSRGWNSQRQIHQYTNGDLSGVGGPAFSSHFPSAPAMTVDITGDGENDVIYGSNGPLSPSNRGIVALTSESNYSDRVLFATEYNYWGQGFISPTVIDLERDGKLDIIAASAGDYRPSDPTGSSSKRRFSIYAFETQGAVTSADGQWASFLGNPDHNGCLNCTRAMQPLEDPGPQMTRQPFVSSVDTLNVTFAVVASGTNLRYQWERSYSDSWGWFPLPDQTGATLTVNRYEAYTYSYRVRVSTPTRSVMSDPAGINVSRLPNDQVCPTTSFKIVPGVCGCETLDDDIDRDGTVDCLERKLYSNPGPASIKRSKKGRRVTIEIPVIQGASRYSVTLRRVRSGKKVVETITRSARGRRFVFDKLRSGTYKVKWTATVTGIPGMSTVSGPNASLSVR